jgi:hypothetical protein
MGDMTTSLPGTLLIVLATVFCRISSSGYSLASPLFFSVEICDSCEMPESCDVESRSSDDFSKL